MIIDSCPCLVDLSKRDMLPIWCGVDYHFVHDSIASLADRMIFSWLDSFQNRHTAPRWCVFSWGDRIWAQILDQNKASSRFATRAVGKMEKMRRFHRNRCEKLVEEILTSLWSNFWHPRRLILGWQFLWCSQIEFLSCLWCTMVITSSCGWCYFSCCVAA